MQYDPAVELKSLLVALDRRSRFLDRVGLGRVRTVARRALGATVARTLTARVDGLVFDGTIQHRSYLERLQRGSAEPFTAHLLREATSPGSVFVDVGAYLGYYTLSAAAAGARVVSFEPNPRTRAHLVSNIARNALADRITLHPFAVSFENGSAIFFIGDGDQSASGLARTRSNVEPIEVETRRLDDLVELADVVKIDVEGAEVRALRGMGRLLSLDRPMTMIVECNPAGLSRMGDTAADLVKRLESAGFEVSVVDEHEGALLPAAAALEVVEGYVNLHAAR